MVLMITEMLPFNAFTNSVWKSRMNVHADGTSAVTSSSAPTQVVTATTGVTATPSPSLLPVKGYLDHPKANITISGNSRVSGWFLDPNGVNKIEVYIDGILVGQAIYGSTRTDVYNVYPEYNNKNSGYYLDINTRNLSNGTHTMVIKETGNNLQQTSLTARTFIVANETPTPTYTPIPTPTYTPTNKPKAPTQVVTPTPSMLPVKGYLDNPKANAVVSGNSRVKGWFLDPNGINKIEVYIDGILAGQAIYGSERIDVYNVYPEYNNKNSGYYLDINTTNLPDGTHTMVIKETGNNLQQTSLTARTFIVANGTPTPTYTPIPTATYTPKNTPTNTAIATSQVVTPTPSLLPVKGYLENPKANAVISGNRRVTGWFLDPNGVNKIEVYIDGILAGQAIYGSERIDVYNVYPQYNNKNSGYYLDINTRNLSDGIHTMVVKETGNNLQQTSLTARTFIVANATPTPTCTPTNTPTNTPIATPIVTHVGGNITQNTTWTSKYTYIVDSSITIQQGVTLTVEPGVVIKVKAGYTGKITVQGKLNAIGTATAPIVFTSYTDSNAGYWRGILVTSTGEMVGDNIKIRYAQIAGYNKSALDVHGKLTLTNSEIIDSNGQGIHIDTSSDVLISGNKIVNAKSNGIYIKNVTTGTLTVENNTIEGNGATGIAFENYGIGTLSIKGNTIKDNKGYAIYVPLGGLKSSIFGAIQNNIYTNNINEGALFDGIVTTGTPTIDLTLNAGTYYMDGSITIPTGKVLTVEPGVVIKAKARFNGEIIVQGKLNAIGTATAPIVFTSYTDSSAGYWRGILVTSTGEMVGDNIKIRYAQIAGYNKSALDVHGKLTLTNSEISNSNGYSIYFDTDDVPFMYYNTFKNNANCMYNKNSADTIDVSYNYWGSPNGPSIYDTTTSQWIGDGDKIGSGFTYTPYFVTETKYPLTYDKGFSRKTPGNYTRSFTDMTVAAPGFDIQFTRTYNSLNTKSTLMGKGWTFGYECRVKNAEYSYVDLTGKTVTGTIPSVVIVNLPDGSTQSFNVKKGGTYVAADSRNTLTKENGTYKLTTKTQENYYFNADGYLVKMEDKNGNKVDIEVDSSGKITGIKDQLGRHYTITYENNMIKSIKEDGSQITVVYGYENGRLVSVKDPAGNYTYYTYSTNGLLSSIQDAAHKPVETVVYYQTTDDKDKINKLTNSTGNTDTYVYDNVNRKITITDSKNNYTVKWYDDSYNVTTMRDKEGRITAYEYNQYSEIKSETDRNNNTTQYERDSKGNNQDYKPR